MKKPSRKTIVAKLDKVFSEYIRARDTIDGWGNCFTCRKNIPMKGSHAGHFISRRHHATRWDERNVHLQDAGCNTFRGGAPHEYFIHMEEVYGRDVVDELMELKKHPAKFSVKDLKEMYEHYKNKLDSI